MIDYSVTVFPPERCFLKHTVNQFRAHVPVYFNALQFSVKH